MERIMSRRGAILELAIVTVGVLIALSFDTVRQWRSNAALAAEARANLMTEIAENKEQLDDTLTQLEVNKKAFVAAHRGARNLIAGRPLGMTKIDLNTRLAELSDAAFTTAEVTGAFAHMDYEDVRLFAGLYDFQRRFVAIQNAALGEVSWLSAPLILGDGPDNLSIAEIQEWKRGLERAVGSMTVQGQLGTLLSRSYARILKPVE